MSDIRVGQSIRAMYLCPGDKIQIAGKWLRVEDRLNDQNNKTDIQLTNLDDRQVVARLIVASRALIEIDNTQK